MDESSYSILEIPMNQAWPRAVHADLINRLGELGAKRVVMDVLFLGPSGDKKADEKLSKALKNVPTVIGADSGVREQGSAGGRYAMEEILEPLDILRDNAETVALVRMPDDFGQVRRFAIQRSLITKDIPTLYEAAAGLKPGMEGLPGERDYLLYYGPPSTIPTYAYHQVLNPSGGLPKEAVKDKIIFVGLNLRTEIGPAQKDSYKTPFYERGSMFGVEIQASATANILTKNWIHRASTWTEGIAAFVGVLAVMTAIFALKPVWGGVLLVAFSLLWTALSYFLFLSGFFLPGVVFVCGVLPISYLASTLTYYVLTHRKQQQVEKAFQFYLSPDMAKKMRDNPKGLELGGENVYATALFTDIAGFTEVTESMSASQVSTMLNAYFTEVMNVVFENKGTLIKFIGDAVFVLWGAPIKLSEHASLAAQSAVAIQKEVYRFNASKRFPPLITRIGVHTGPMVVGNLGSEKRFDYTAIGDSVNLAARLEGLNKYFGTYILISENTRKEIGNSLKTLQLGSVVVAGKKERVGVYTMFEEPVSSSIEERWNKALSAFRLRRWEEAKKLFEEIGAEDERLKKAARLYIEQISMHSSKTPDDEWQGEIIFGQK